MMLIEKGLSDVKFSFSNDQQAQICIIKLYFMSALL